MPTPSRKRLLVQQTGVNRRQFIQLGAAGAIALNRTNVSAREPSRIAEHSKNNSCILIVNVGGMSQLDTLDPKPDAPREVRGPFKTIQTNNPEIQISELFPLHAKLADKFSLIRSCHHDSGSDHNTALRLIQTSGSPRPHIGCVADYLLRTTEKMPGHVILPEQIGLMGGYSDHGQNAGFLGAAYDPCSCETHSALPENAGVYDLSQESLKTRERYGLTGFGESCLLARRLVEHGIRFVTINTFSTIFNQATWDIHGCKPFSTMSAMKNVVAPMYDQAYSALIEDLHQRGMLDSTLVAVLSEFGRTPRLNRAGGRDHWPHCFTSYFAGGGIQGGRVIGKSDRMGAYPADRPVSVNQISATIFHSLGLNLSARLPGPSSRNIALVDPGTAPLLELF